MSVETKKGSALIFVLWIIGLLGMLVASFAFEARIEARMTSYYHNRTKADYLARSGLEIAELVMDKSHGLAGKELDEEKAATDEWYLPAQRLSDGSEVEIEHDLAESGDGEGVIRVRITPEPALINVNMLTAARGDKSDRRWEAILEVGGVPEEMWGELIDSFYDWTDSDDTPRAEGAENDYYEELDKPYRARNGPLDTVGELRLIKGFSRAVVYGGVLDEDESGKSGLGGGLDGEQIRCSGIADMLTTYGDGRINVNAASRRVLMTLPDMDDNLVDLIQEERSGWVDDSGVKHDESFKNASDFMSRIPEIDSGIKNMITTQSSIYRVTATGEVNGVKRSLWCIVRYTGRSLEILRWREDD